jgi:hypothetical protein
MATETMIWINTLALASAGVAHGVIIWGVLREVARSNQIAAETRSTTSAILAIEERIVEKLVRDSGR